MEEDHPVDGPLRPTVAALALSASKGERRIGMAILQARRRRDASDRVHTSFLAASFVDNSQYCNLESFLLQFSIEKCFIPNSGISDGEMKKLEDVFETTSVELVPIPKSKFSSSDLEQDVCRLLGVPNVALHRDIVADPLASSALAAIIAQEDLLKDTNMHGACSLDPAPLQKFMKLDAAATKALNLFSTKQSLAGNRNIDSVHGLLSAGCTTVGGRRLISMWLRQPLLQVKEIEARQQLVECFVEDSELRQRIRDMLRVPDLDALTGRLERKKASLMDLVRVYHFAMLLPNLVSALQASTASHAAQLRETFVAELKAVSADFDKYCEMIKTVVEDVGSPEPRVNPTWDSRLEQLAREKEDTVEDINLLSDKAKETWGADLDVKCESDKVRGVVFRTKRTNDKKVRKLPNVEVLAVLKDGVRFTTLGPKGLRTLGKRLQELDSEYSQLQQELVEKAVDIGRSYVPVIEAAATAVASLDAICSLGHVAATAPIQYCKPKVLPSEAKDLNITGARHPVMEMSDETVFIANDYNFHQGKSRFHIITGPNMGGKSTYIRQLGVLAVMAQIGSFIPAEAATMSIFDCVLARVGAGDAQLRGVSTFMAEMLEASAILETATDQSLVIIDELGRGTSTYDGFGLAWAISEWLATKVKCACLFATHFHELTALANQVEGVINRHVTAHTTEDTITMLYEVRDGPCPSSFGIHVAELAAFPPSVIEEARKKAIELEEVSAKGREILNSLTSRTSAVAMERKEDLDTDMEGGSAAITSDSATTKFLQQFAALPLDQMGEEKAIAAATQLLQQFQGTPGFPIAM